ncbi:PHP domain-containing protein [Halorientalis brevis]|uniref:PHP domain-containing protein n=1 Tax=Halorientalis brevis TaxID=1126241 RepID=A0ABD6CCX7_9EURY|nr:PHP domain-containing protein [Halorientalis brevis]
MEPSAGIADLHVHTTASDGTSSVAERVAQAADRGLEAIAITDHDAISETLTEPVTRRDGLEVVTGVEARADVEGTKIEILGYYVSPENERLRELLARAREFRHERNEALIENLNAATGLSLDYDDLQAAARGSLGRPHVAQALVDAGLVDSIDAAFAEYLGTDSAAYVEMERQDYTAVIDAIHAAGGVASLAHPGRIRSDGVPELVATLADAGLDAIEVAYPYGGDSGPAKRNEVGVQTAADLAETNDLLATGGSDCHGPDSGKYRLGEVRVTRAELDAIRDRATV